MHDSPSTHPSLLLRIRDERDRQAWDEFVALYGPLIYGYLHKCGLQDADAADLTQDVLLAVARAIGGFSYDRSIGAFRAWLLTITRNKLRNFVAARGRRPQASGDSAAQELLNQQPDPSDAEQEDWDREYEQRLFQWAVERVRPQVQPATWQAFWATAVEGQPPQQVAERLGITVGAVYIAKSRVTARIKEQIERVGD